MAAQTETLDNLRGQAGGQSQPPAQKGINYFLKNNQAEIKRALPRHMDADRMARIAMTEMRRTPDLLNADPKTLFGAVIQASQLGLEPGGALGHCYLLPFVENRGKRNEQTTVQLIIGYRGMIDLARRSGQIVSLRARAVYEQDEFHYEFGLREDLTHKPYEGENAGELTHVYAVAELKDGGVQFEVLPIAKIEAIRKSRKGAKAKAADERGPWSTHYAEMAKKSAIRALFKYLPVSVELQRAVAIDEQGDAGMQHNDDVLDLDPSDWSTADAPAAEPEAPAAEASANDSGDNSGPSGDEIVQAIRQAPNREELDVRMDASRDLTGDALAEAQKAYRDRSKELEGDSGAQNDMGLD
ncbi:recombination protein RecT [Halofilum ochraceum]|uniref:recombination protein RecT n=1 Tax=Halofilum ochraceum TaxID=1611323 RepID=UPI0008DAA010|nr:recombination protein RecT [Halofilum ochraceum]